MCGCAPCDKTKSCDGLCETQNESARGRKFDKFDSGRVSHTFRLDEGGETLFVCKTVTCSRCTHKREIASARALNAWRRSVQAHAHTPQVTQHNTKLDTQQQNFNENVGNVNTRLPETSSRGSESRLGWPAQNRAPIQMDPPPLSAVLFCFLGTALSCHRCYTHREHDLAHRSGG